MGMSCIILAAGSSSRMTKYKQLLFYKGKTLIKQLGEILSSLTFQKIVCVTGFLRVELENELRGLGIEFIHNDNHLAGQTSSLKIGIEHLAIEEGTNAVLICLTDQPKIPHHHYQDLIKSAKENPSKIIATFYGNTFGVPSVIPHEYFQEFISLPNNGSPKSILKKHRDNLILIKCEAASQDIDTDEDYKKLIADA